MLISDHVGRSYKPLNTWPIWREFLELKMLFLDRGFPLDYGISLQGFKCEVKFWENVQHTCTNQDIYGVGQVKLKVKWLERFEKSKIWLKCYGIYLVYLHLNWESARAALTQEKDFSSNILNQIPRQLKNEHGWMDRMPKKK